MGLLRKPADQVWNHPKREKCVLVNKAGAVEVLKSALTLDVEMAESGVF